MRKITLYFGLKSVFFSNNFSIVSQSNNVQTTLNKLTNKNDQLLKTKYGYLFHSWDDKNYLRVLPCASKMPVYQCLKMHLHLLSRFLIRLYFSNLDYISSNGSKELSLWHKLWFSNSYISATQCKVNKY